MNANLHILMYSTDKMRDLLISAKRAKRDLSKEMVVTHVTEEWETNTTSQAWRVMGLLPLSHWNVSFCCIPVVKLSHESPIMLGRLKITKHEFYSTFLSQSIKLGKTSLKQ